MLFAHRFIINHVDEPCAPHVAVPSASRLLSRMQSSHIGNDQDSARRFAVPFVLWWNRTGMALIRRSRMMSAHHVLGVFASATYKLNTYIYIIRSKKGAPCNLPPAPTPPTGQMMCEVKIKLFHHTPKNPKAHTSSPRDAMMCANTWICLNIHLDIFCTLSISQKHASNT